MTTQGTALPTNLKATNDLAEAVAHGELVLTVIPTPFLGRTIASVKDKFKPNQIIISCTKGIVNDTLETPDEILSKALPDFLKNRYVRNQATLL